MKVNHTLKFLAKALRPFKVWLIGFFMVNLLLAFSSSLKPYALKGLINFLAKDRALDFALPVLYYIFASLFTVFCFRLHNFIWINLAPPLRYNLTNLLTKEVTTHSLAFFQNQSPSKLGNHIQEISKKIPELIQTIFDGFFCGGLTLIIATTAVGTINYRFAIGLLSWITIFISGSIFILRHAKKIGAEGSHFRSKILSKIVERLRNIQCIRLFVRSEIEDKKLQVILDAHLISDKKKERYIVSTYGFQGVTFFLYQAICLVWLINGLKEKILDLGDITFILGINVIFVDYFRKISQHIIDFTDLFGAIKYSINELLPSSFTKEKNEGLPSITAGTIHFENVSFAYRERPLLFQNISTRIEMGEKVAIIGHSGSGKSTFIHLVLRLYDISSGKIHIGGKNIKNVSLDSLRAMISIVPQFPSLFEGTIAENIQYGKLDATTEEVERAAKLAEIHDFISQLPLGYNTLLDSSASTLSAGQRQRIAIARALIKEASILILDEPMTHLDLKTAEQIENNLYKIANDKMLIVITHHLSSFLSKADKILVFESGSVCFHNTLDQKENQPHTIDLK